MYTFIGLEPVAPVPITTALNQRLSAPNVLLDKVLVAKEKADPDERENQVNLGAENPRVLENVLVCGDGFLLQSMELVESSAIHHCFVGSHSYLVTNFGPELSPLSPRSLDFCLSSLLHCFILLFLNLL